MVEMALLLPVLLIILIGAVDLGRVFYSYITVTNAAREGARYGAANPPVDPSDPTDDHVVGIIDRVTNEASGQNIVIMSVGVACPSGSCAHGDPIQVDVNYSFQLITGFIFRGGAIPLRASQQMMIYGQ